MHPEDTEHIEDVRSQLVAHRVSLGITLPEASAASGYSSPEFVKNFERSQPVWSLARFQRVASIYDLVVAWTLYRGFSEFCVVHDTELDVLREMAYSPTAHHAQREYLKMCLKSARLELGMTARDAAEPQGISASTVHYRESDEAELSVPIVMSHARALGLRLKWRLVPNALW